MKLPTALEIWIVDDDEATLAAVEHALRRAGWSVQSFATAGEMKERLAVDSPACIVTDLCIGGDDGLALIEYARQASWPVPSILMSGHLSPSLTARAMRRGVQMVLEKPFAMDAMLSEVAAAMDEAEQRLARKRRKLTARQALQNLSVGHLAVLEELVKCTPHKQIASRLDIALRTVEKRKKEIFERLQVETFTEVLAMLHAADDARSPLILPDWHVNVRQHALA